MNNDLQKILDTLPPKLPRSRLQPFSELISEMLRQGRTYREIVTVLREKCNIRVVASTVHHYVRVHQKRKRKERRPLIEGHSAPPNSHKANTRVETGADVAGGSKTVGERIADLKKRQALTVSTKTFRYDPEEPLRLKERQKT